MHLDDTEHSVDTLTAAVVSIAVALLVLLGAVLLLQRQEAVDAYERTPAVALEGGAGSPGASASPSSTPAAEPDAPGEYTVRRGDSLFSVAAAFGVTPNELIFWNAETYPTLRSTPGLRPGWVLRITGPPLPTATPEATPTAAPTPVLAVPGVPPVTAASFPASDRVTVAWYEVTGASPAEIFASILANGPTSEWVGGAATAHVAVTPSFDFFFQTGPVGSCEVVATGDPAISLTYEVLLPAWTPPDGVAVDPDTVEWWADELASTVAHEARHITLYEEHLPDMRDAVADASCESVEDDLIGVWDAAVRANCEFDMDEYGTASGLSLDACVAGH